jgi:hypothetical protein
VFLVPFLSLDLLASLTAICRIVVVVVVGVVVVVVVVATSPFVFRWFEKWRPPSTA